MITYLRDISAKPRKDLTLFASYGVVSAAADAGNKSYTLISVATAHRTIPLKKINLNRIVVV